MAKMGRNPIPKSERKSFRINVFFTPAEGRRINRVSGNQYPAQWARAVLLEAVEEMERMEEE